MYKTKVQELCQRRSWPLPTYDTTREGPDHDPRFTSTVTVNGLSFQTSAPTRNSKSAQNDAAMLAFLHFSPPSSSPSPSPSPPSPSFPQHSLSISALSSFPQPSLCNSSSGTFSPLFTCYYCASSTCVFIYLLFYLFIYLHFVMIVLNVISMTGYVIFFFW